VLPPEVTFIESLPSPDSINGQTLTWDLGSLPAGAKGGILIKTQVGDDLRDGTIIHNAATISSTTTGTTKSNAWDITVLSSAVLTVDKAASIATIGAGDTVTYDITVRNQGSDTAANVQVVDTLPGTTTFIRATGGGTHSGDATGGTVTWTLASLAPGEQAVYHVTAEASATLFDGDALLNTVTASGEKPNNGGSLPQVTDTLTLPVTGQPVFELDYSVNRATVVAGIRLVYTIVTHNIGNANAVDTLLTATLPPGTTPAGIDGGGRFENGRVVWSTSSLPPTGPITLQFAVDPDINLPEGTQFISKANISATNAAPKSGTAFTVLVGEPDIDVFKAGNAEIIAGEDISYRITVQNVGTLVAPGVALVDTLPDGAIYKSASPAPDTVNGQFLRWDLGNVTAGSIVGIDLVVGTDPNTLPQTLNNFAQVSDLLRDADVSQWQTREKASPTLDVTITPDQPTHRPGETVVYTVTWANNGNNNVTGALVEAWLPPGTTYQFATNNGGLSQDSNLSPHVEWAVGDLTRGATGQATFTVDIGSNVASGTRLDSAADISANTGLPDSDNAVVDIYDGPPPFQSEAVMPVPITGRWLWLLAGLMAGWVLLRGRPQLA
jgi:uncharacterized repeat protein (TIGR01451 family)